MAFYINSEQKVRIALSTRARITMREDMETFGETKAATFINTVIANYKDDAKSSIHYFLQQRKLELEELFRHAKLDNEAKRITIEHLLSAEKSHLIAEINAIKKNKVQKGDNKLYHINSDNFTYLTEDCNEDDYYNGQVGFYLRCLMEEYCSLPFIKRQRIYQKSIFDTIDRAIATKSKLKITTDYNGKAHDFHVFPYKIVEDPFLTQSYLACYSKLLNDNTTSDKIRASFSIARIQKVRTIKSASFLSRELLNDLEAEIAKHSVAYLLGETEEIKIKLTKNGKKLYQNKLFARPEKIEFLSTEDIYVFNCTQRQAFNYFFSFGKNAEVLSPPQLRETFKNTLSSALEIYKNK